jgi:hypothetical protein
VGDHSHSFGAQQMASDLTRPISDDLAEALSNASAAAVPGRNDFEIGVDKSDQLAALIAPSLGIEKYPVAIISSALLFAWGGALWLGASNLDWFLGRSASPPPQQAISAFNSPEQAKSASIPAKQVIATAGPAKADRLEMSIPATGRASAVIPGDGVSGARVTRPQEIAKKGARRIHSASLLTKLNTEPSGQPSPQRTKVSTRAVPVPETRPTTIDGWTVLDVNGGRVVLEGPNGIRNATRGDSVPELGKIDSVMRWGNRWIVATSRGLISTP